SVLMNIIAGLEKPDSGSVQVSGGVGLVFQEADTQILGETPREDVAVGPKNQKKSRKEIDALVESALSQTLLSEKADFPSRFLSGGQKRRLAVACMIAMENSVIIFDEPYANLDFGGVKQVNSLIRKLKESGRTVLILSHELEKCLALADRFIVLFRGDKVFDGKPEDALRENLEDWNIRNPLVRYEKLSDLVW
ncbi:MAG: ABC transporter ATP-binding protein, partial [Treponema sp.]|nr:ABC transporter ATP-binding protein [Treponema sp.]